MADWPNGVTKKDLRIEFYRGSGPGGQHRNKRDTACRITHIPTGISATCQEHKSQMQNKQTAFRRLAEQLVPIIKKESQKERYRSPSERVRTYNHKNDRVTDERIPGKIFSYTDVLDRDGFSKIVEHLIKGGSDERD